MRRLPIACAPSAFPSSDLFAEHLTEGRRLASLALTRQELADGWALHFPRDEDVLVACARWIAKERRCCPFFTFSLECEPDPGGLWMRLTGPEGAKDVLRMSCCDEREQFRAKPGTQSGFRTSRHRATVRADVRHGRRRERPVAHAWVQRCRCPW